MVLVVVICQMNVLVPSGYSSGYLYDAS
uniref:Uncharacterized protein n=1 Tax=Rhizophora mucronata TaxID=61149 RepID=A0A2P2PXX9_RHIMU